MPKTDISGEEVRALWATKEYSLQQLADHFGVSRQAIHYHVTPRTKPKVLIVCDGCGEKFLYERKRGRPKKVYCPECPPPARREVWQELAKEILE